MNRFVTFVQIWFSICLFVYIITNTTYLSWIWMWGDDAGYDHIFYAWKRKTHKFREKHPWIANNSKSCGQSRIGFAADIKNVSIVWWKWDRYEWKNISFAIFMVAKVCVREGAKYKINCNEWTIPNSEAQIDVWMRKHCAVIHKLQQQQHTHTDL